MLAKRHDVIAWQGKITAKARYDKPRGLRPPAGKWLSARPANVHGQYMARTFM